MEVTANPDSISAMTEIEVVDFERARTGRYREKRTSGEIERDLDEISSLYLRGKKPAEIAQELVDRHHYDGLSVGTINLELKKLREMWVQSALINYDVAKAREIAHVDELESTAWDAWNKSWGKQTIDVKEAIQDRFGHRQDSQADAQKKPATYSRQRGTSTTKDRFGDSRYLDTIKWCIETRCKILGLNEPTRLAISWQSEAVKTGISPEDAESMFKQMVGFTTKALRDKYLKDNSIEIPDNILDGEFSDDEDDDGLPDDTDE